MMHIKDAIALKTVSNNIKELAGQCKNIDRLLSEIQVGTIKDEFDNELLADIALMQILNLGYNMRYVTHRFADVSHLLGQIALSGKWDREGCDSE